MRKPLCITKEDLTSNLNNASPIMPFTGEVGSEILVPNQFGDKAANHGWEFRKIPVVINGNVSTKKAGIMLAAVDQYLDDFLLNQGYKVAATLYSKVLKTKVKPIDVKKNTLLDHVQLQKGMVLLGYNTTVYDGKFAEPCSMIISFLNPNSFGFRYMISLVDWKK